MKKFWNLMLSALVIMGAVACTENDANLDDTPEVKSGISFEAAINVDDNTRADVVFNEETNKWNTVWTGDEILVVTRNSDGKAFEFANTEENKGRFTCADAEESDLVGLSVTIALKHDGGATIDSKAGKAGGGISATMDTFNIAGTVLLNVNTAFLRYSSAEEVTFEAGSPIFVYDGAENNSITLPAGTDVWVAVNTAENVELSYSVNGVECKTTTLNIAAKKIYNLGELTFPYEVSAYSIPGTHNEWSTTATPMYKVGDYCVAYGVEFAAAENTFKVLGNNKWLGVDNYTMGTWMTLSTDAGNIYVPAGKYDIYYSEADNKVCVVEAGAEVPAMPVFSIGVIGFGGNWDVDTDMTLDGDYYTLKSVAIAATDTFKLRVSDTWAENYGIASTETVESIAINADTMYTLVQDGKNMQLAAGTYDLYFNYNTKEFYALTPGTTPDDLAIPQYKIYVYNYETEWSNIYLYTWDSADVKHTGEWPGSVTTTTETINGYEYMVWTMPRAATGKPMNAILNNGAGAQTQDHNLDTLSENKYIILNNGVAYDIEDVENPEPEIPAVTYKVYVFKYNNTWTTLNLYTWDNTTNVKYTGAWPGNTTTTTEVINGYTYHVWEMPATAVGRQFKMILNNGTAQTGDSEAYTLDKDIYVRLNGAAIQNIDDPNNPEPTVESVARKVYATTTLSWSKMNIYAWNGGADFDWPGTAMSTETINGTKYYVYTFDKSMDGSTISVIFNNGSAQTVDITNVKLDKDRFFRVLTTKSGNKYKYEEIADPR